MATVRSLLATNSAESRHAIALNLLSLSYPEKVIIAIIMQIFVYFLPVNINPVNISSMSQSILF